MNIDNKTEPRLLTKHELREVAYPCRDRRKYNKRNNNSLFQGCKIPGGEAVSRDACGALQELPFKDCKLDEPVYSKRRGRIHL